MEILKNSDGVDIVTDEKMISLSTDRVKEIAVVCGLIEGRDENGENIFNNEEMYNNFMDVDKIEKYMNHIDEEVGKIVAERDHNGFSDAEFMRVIYEMPLSTKMKMMLTMLYKDKVSSNNQLGALKELLSL